MIGRWHDALRRTDVVAASDFDRVVDAGMKLFEENERLRAERDEWRNQVCIGVAAQFDEGKKYEARVQELEAELAAARDELNRSCKGCGQ